ncbi:MAG: hypothetical protein RIQ68_444, partial [Pseudomonadota bacterium]
MPGLFARLAGRSTRAPAEAKQ